MIVPLDEDLLQPLLVQAHESPRKRSHKNLHRSYDEPVQRLCIALVAGTYVRPHHHPQADKWEMTFILKGSVALVLFDEQGGITERLTLSHGSSLSVVEIRPNTWHTLYPLSPEAVIMEVKEGPYTPAQEEDFALWSPKEGDPKVDNFLAWVAHATVGDHYHSGLEA